MLTNLDGLLKAVAHDTPPEGAERATAEARLCEEVERLPQRERVIIVRRWGLDGNGKRPLADVAAEVGLPRERARLLEVNALNRLASAL